MRERSGTPPGGARGGHDECGAVQAWGGLCGAAAPPNDGGSVCLLLPGSPPRPSPIRGPLTSGAARPSWRATGGGGLAARKLALGDRRSRAWEADARCPGTVTKGGKRRLVRDREDRAWGRNTVSLEAAKASLASPGLHAGTWLAQAGAESAG